ncbi:hypothetical protein TL16_g06583 [Triparma laevis f. inornata]|uniref:KATNIP domain-containing protein n=1 Tax=Triparma laevis f. inornata TaxID=1714386 RepID=A0A9W7EDI6_9STRA|nr:hypothetical protein TL16_g06583 [Triparma laevis f. inornata]
MLRKLFRKPNSVPDNKENQFTPSGPPLNNNPTKQTRDVLSPGEKQKEYIRMLEERNRLKKQVEIKQKTKTQLDAEKREAGFNTNFGGANSNPTSKITLIQVKNKSKIKKKESISLASPVLIALDHQSNTGAHKRRQWSKPSKQILKLGSHPEEEDDILADFEEYDEDNYDDDEFDEYEGTLTMKKKEEGGLKMTGEQINEMLPLSPNKPEEVAEIPKFLPAKKVNLDITPMRRPSSARARAVKADMCVQSFDFGNNRNLDFAKYGRSVDVRAGDKVGGGGGGMEESITGSLVKQIGNLTVEQQRRLMEKLSNTTDDDDEVIVESEVIESKIIEEEVEEERLSTPLKDNTVTLSPHQDATPKRMTTLGQPRKFDKGFGQTHGSLSSTETTPDRSGRLENDFLEQSLESLTKFNNTRPLVAATLVEREKAPSPDQDKMLVNFEAKGKNQAFKYDTKGATMVLRVLRKQQSKTIMDRIKEAEMSVLAATRFSSDDDDDDDENEIEGTFAPSPAAKNLRKTLAPLTTEAPKAEGSPSVIPTFPSGKHLKFDILSTWGDPHYVGLSGLEIFAKSGFVVDLTAPNVTVAANPPSVNVLSADGKDPRTVDKLFDGQCHTCSDLHTWLTPWGLSQTVTIEIDLGEETTLSMIRFWNYNKNRQQSYRGVKDVRVQLDATVIFEGEVRRAAGGLNGPEECSDAVLFTTDDEILNAIEERDETLYPKFRTQQQSDVSETLVQRIKKRMELDRPRTACGDDSFEKDFGDENVRPSTRAGLELGVSSSSPMGGAADIEADLFGDDEIGVGKFEEEERPENDEVEDEDDDDDDDDINAMLADVGDGRISFSPKASLKKKQTAAAAAAPLPPTEVSTTFACDGVTIKIHATHETQIDKTRMSLSGSTDGSAPSSYVGLGGIRLLRHDGTQIIMQDMTQDVIDATPRDLHSLGYTNDERKISNLYSTSSNPISISDSDMWLVPDSVTAGTIGADGSVSITIKFGQRIEDLFAVQVWNYNKVPLKEDGKFDFDIVDEDSLRGAAVCSVSLKNCEKLGSYPIGAYRLRRGPSVASFDYSQTLELSKPHSIEFDDLLNLDKKGGMKRLISNFKPCNNLRQDYETPFLPCGMLLKLVVHGGWGDPYYVGLDKFEICDAYGKKVKVKEVGACPKDLSSIGIVDDVRVAQNLVNGDEAPWLAPLAVSMSEGGDVAPGYENENVVYFTLDEPTHIGAVKIFNYGKTPKRGVRDFSLFIDGLIVYRGYAERSDRVKNGHSILFCGEESVLEAVGGGKNLTYCGVDTQDVECIDEGVVRIKSRFKDGPVIDPCAEGVKSDLSRRPRTSVSRR